MKVEQWGASIFIFPIYGCSLKKGCNFFTVTMKQAHVDEPFSEEGERLNCFVLNDSILLLDILESRLVKWGSWYWSIKNLFDFIFNLQIHCLGKLTSARIFTTNLVDIGNYDIWAPDRIYHPDWKPLDQPLPCSIVKPNHVKASLTHPSS